MESKVNKGKDAIPAVFRRDGSARTAGAVSENKGGYKIADTSTTAKVGDIYRAETGTAALIYKECVVIEANTNDFTIASKIAPANGDTFFILAPVNLRVDGTGAIATSVAGGATEAKQDVGNSSLASIDGYVEQLTYVVAAPGAAAPGSVQVVGGTDGTNARILKVDSDGNAQVDVLTLPAIPAGNNNIGDVDIASIAAGDNNIGNVDVVTLPSIPAGNNNIGDVDIASIAAGDNNIGNVDIVTMPALPAGTNNIGDVDVLTLPAIPAGTNTIGYTNPNVTASGNITTQNLVPAGTATAGSAVELSLDSGLQSVAVQVTGTYTGALSAQYTVGTTNVWVTMSSTNFVTLADGLYNSGISSAATGIYLIPANGATKVRITGLAAMTGTAVVTMTGSKSPVPGINGSKYPRVDLASIAQNAIATGNGTAGSSTIRTALAGLSSATVASVADAASNTTILASNASRSGACFFNDSTEVLYLKFGTTATTTDFTVKIAAGGYYELPGPNVYTGNIDGIWAANASGSVRVTYWS